MSAMTSQAVLTICEVNCNSHVRKSAPYERRTARDSTLEINPTCSHYFRKYRRLHKRDHTNSILSRRRLEQIANLNPVARHRTADRLRNPTPLRQRKAPYPRYTRTVGCRTAVEKKSQISVLARLCSILSRHRQPERRFNA